MKKSDARKAPTTTPLPITAPNAVQSGRVVSLYVDGNSVSAMAVARTGADAYRVDCLEHLELDELMEIVKRLRHPIFMDVNLCLFPEREVLQKRIARLLEKNCFADSPVVLLIAPEKVHRHEVAGRTAPKGVSERREQLFLSHLPVNPYEYPSVLLFRERQGADKNQAQTSMVRIRLADFVQMSQLGRSITGREVLGFITPQAAATQAMARLSHDDGHSGEVLLCDLGKLRTVYVRLPENGPIAFHPIPVGLARDDMHYFQNISPNLANLENIRATMGTLLFPPDATPSPLFTGGVSSPQVDCTRLAVQISRYALRAFGVNGANPETTERYLTGRGSRMPGLRQYIENKVGEEFRRVDRRPLNGVELAEGLRWGDIGDNLLLLGAAIEALSPNPHCVGVISTQYYPLGRGRSSTLSELANCTPYVLEQR